MCVHYYKFAKYMQTIAYLRDYYLQKEIVSNKN